MLIHYGIQKCIPGFVEFPVNNLRWARGLDARHVCNQYIYINVCNICLF